MRGIRVRVRTRVIRPPPRALFFFPSLDYFVGPFRFSFCFILADMRTRVLYDVAHMLGTTRRTTALKLGGVGVGVGLLPSVSFLCGVSCQGFASAAALNGGAAPVVAPVVVERAPQQCRSNAPSLWGGLGRAPFVERYSFAFTHVRESSSSSTVDAYKVGESTNIKWHEGSVSREAREQSMGQKGCVLWFTGLSGSGKSTVAYTLEHALHGMGKKVYVMDGDNIRHGLNSNLGFSAADREENIRRIGEVAKLFADMGVITLVSFISPYRNDRDLARSRMARDTDFVEVFMKIPIEICETRDPKGLYKAARAGKLKGFTGIDDPYEEPLNAEIVVEAKKEASDELEAPEAMASTILDYLSTKGYLSA